MIDRAAASWRRFLSLGILAIILGIIVLITGGWFALIGWVMIKIGQWVFA